MAFDFFVHKSISHWTYHHIIFMRKSLISTILNDKF